MTSCILLSSDSSLLLYHGYTLLLLEFGYRCTNIKLTLLESNLDSIGCVLAPQNCLYFLDFEFELVFFAELDWFGFRPGFEDGFFLEHFNNKFPILTNFYNFCFVSA